MNITPRRRGKSPCLLAGSNTQKLHKAADITPRPWVAWPSAVPSVPGLLPQSAPQPSSLPSTAHVQPHVINELPLEWGLRPVGPTIAGARAVAGAQVVNHSELTLPLFAASCRRCCRPSSCYSSSRCCSSSRLS